MKKKTERIQSTTDKEKGREIEKRHNHPLQKGVISIVLASRHIITKFGLFCKNRACVTAVFSVSYQLPLSSVFLSLSFPLFLLPWTTAPHIHLIFSSFSFPYTTIRKKKKLREEPPMSVGTTEKGFS